MGRVVGYARVSSRDQSLARQISALTAAGVAEGDLYSDVASGKDFEREGYRSATADLREGDLLIVCSIDRLGRDYREISNEWRRVTEALGADIRILDFPILDTAKGMGDLTGAFISDIALKVLSYVAEQERAMIKRRQAEGIAAAKSRGMRFGRPPIAVPAEFAEIRAKARAGEITVAEALARLNLKRTTYYKFAAARDA